MAQVIEVDVNRFRTHKTQPVQRLPRRTSDPRANTPIGTNTAQPQQAAAVILPGEPEQAAVMRRRIRSRTGTLGSMTEVLVLLADELFTNALRHTRSGEPDGEVTVALFKLPDRFQVKVTDQGPREGEHVFPCPRPLNVCTEGGFGLHLVAAEASRWGTLQESGRTTVWFEFDRPGKRT